MAQHRIENPSLEAYLLLRGSHIVNDLSDIYVRPDIEPEPGSIKKFHELLGRRIKHEPIAYISGEKEFYSRDFAVNRHVLIPRPETELLAGEAINAAGPMENPVILDIGTGSGCIAVTLACELKDAALYAADISMEALRTARRNTEKHSAEKRVTLTRGNLSYQFKEMAFDMVVSNPPYVSLSEYELLEPGVRDYEPGLALMAGEDGLHYIREIIADAGRVLKNGGWCLLEVGAGQAKRVKSLFEESGFRETSSVKDLAGIERVVKAKWKR